MRYHLNQLTMFGFLALFVLVLVSQTGGAGARPCNSIDASSIGSSHRSALVHNSPCVKEYLTEGPLYNPMFMYSNSSLSFEIPTMMWSALGKVVFVPATRARVAPNTTTYWFLRVPDSSPTGRSRGFFASSTFPDPGQNELLEYIVVSNQSGIAWVRFPMPAQLRRVEWADPSSNEPNVAGSALAELVAQANIGVYTDSFGDGFFNGAVQANAAATPSPFFTGLYYGNAVIAQTTASPSSLPFAQNGTIGILGSITAAAAQPSPGYESGQIAVGTPYTGEGPGQGLGGLFTAGVAGAVSNEGHGVISFGNNTGLDTWTQIGDSKKHNINGVHNTVISILEKVTPGMGAFNEIGCAMDAGANWGCGGGLFGNAAATPFPSPMASVYPTPTTYPSPYGGPAVIAQMTSAPTPQPGNVLVTGTLAALSHNVCATPSGAPCEFTWVISSFSGGVGTTTVPVPASSVCTVTATQTPIVGSGDVMTTWVTLSGTTLTVHAQDLKGTYSGSFSGNGNCN